MIYKEIFKSKIFWFAFGIFLIYSLLQNYLAYGSLFMMEILGLTLGAFFLTWVLGTVWFFSYKLFNRKPKT